jgi:hypothetical protein
MIFAGWLPAVALLRFVLPAAALAPNGRTR